MKIAMVSEHASPLTATDGLGGPESGRHVHVADLARELGRLGHQVTVYARRDNPQARDRVRLGAGAMLEHVTAGPAVPMTTQESLRFVPEFAAHLARRWAADRDRPDVIHAHSWLSGLAALAGSNGLAVPVVESFHSLGVAARRRGEVVTIERERMERAIGRTATRVIAMSESEHAELIRIGVPRGRLSIVPSGIDTAKFTPAGGALSRGEAARLVTISALDERSGVDTIIKALARIPGAELVVAGGPQREELDVDDDVHRLRIVAKEAGVADRVTFIGRIAHKEVPRLMRSADLTVSLPADTTFGLVPVESMACGVPVVVTATGGHLDTVIDNVTGLQLQVGRTPVEVARKLRALLADPTHRTALGVAAADRAKSRYGWERIADETVKVYEAAAGRAAVSEELQVA
jgi:glycosyltransferase involved in cell wall biosynthesis